MISPAETATAAFHRVFVAHHDGLRRFAFLLGCEMSALDDVVADAFVATFEPWRRGEVVDPGAYLRRAVVNRVIDRARREHTRARWEGRARVAGRADSGDDNAVERARVLEALAQLPDELRAAVVLRHCDDYSEVQTAAVLGVPVGTVKSRTARALERLRPLLEDDDE